MKRVGTGRNFAAAARVAFALMAPAVAGCATSPRAPVPDVCVSPSATVAESRAVVEGALVRISELYGDLMGRLEKVRGELAELPGEDLSGGPIPFVLNAHVPIVEGALRGMKENMGLLRESLSEADGDAEMWVVAQSACAALDAAEVTFTSTMGILDDASEWIRAASEKE